MGGSFSGTPKLIFFLQETIMISPTSLSAWKALLTHHQIMKHIHVRDLFEEDNGRFERFSLEFDDILFDYSKHRITEETMTLLFALAKASHLTRWTDKMFSGEQINITENRAVLHTALRNRSGNAVYVDGQDVMPEIRQTLDKMRIFTRRLHNRDCQGITGEPLTNIVNIGIGGSDLGPAMVTRALTPYRIQGIQPYFVSNIDDSHIVETLKQVRPETTLFIVASKTFTTQETMTNAHSARRWLVNAFGNEAAVARHFVAVSTNTSATAEFGIHPDNIFSFRDWVGGRYSLWSAIGLSIAISIGMDAFEELLDGAFTVDCHFRDTSFEKNIPVIMAMLGIWYANFFGAETHVILPYSQYLDRFAAYLQQADMESNGKRTDRDGKIVNEYTTGPVIWGEPGTNGQHAFYQLIHQGTRLIPADFLAPLHSHHDIGDHHDILLSHCLAQSEALMKGKNLNEVVADMMHSGYSETEIQQIAPHKVFPGNHPSSTFLFSKLNPRTLGRLIALYEHKIFVQGIIWRINSFDQWGVELGKQLAGAIFNELDDAEPANAHDPSTKGLINYCKRSKHTTI
jgi:glucose-6-phosphate isomerase